METTVENINSWKKNHPILLEYVKTGAFCKKNNITVDMIRKCIELKKLSHKQD